MRVPVLLAAFLLSGPAAPSANTVAPAYPVVPMYEQIGDAESIPDHNVNALAMDARGLLLVGTPAGLVRHDGYTFRRLLSPDRVAGNFVRSLAADADGGVWVGTQNGLFHLDATHREFRSFRHDDADAASLPGGSIRALLRAPDGGLWLGGGSEGAVRLAAGSDRFERVRAPDVGSRGLVGAFFALDLLGRLWIGSESGLHRVDDIARLDARPVELTGTAAGNLRGAPITALFVAADGRLWIGNSVGGLYLLDPAQSPALVRELDPGRGPEHWVSGFAQADDRHVWVGRFSGLELRNLAGYVTAADAGSVGLRVSPPATEVLALLRDPSGVVWAGGHNSGLRRLAPVNSAVRRIQPGLAAGVPSINVESVMVRRNGEVWLGSRQRGIAVLDRDMRLLSGQFPGLSLTSNFDMPLVGAMLEAADGTIWIGAADGVHVHDPVAGTSRPASRAAAGIGPVRRLIEGRGGEIYVGAQNGLYCFDKAGVPPRQVLLHSGDPLRVAINALAWDRQGRLWVGSRGGLFVLESGRLRQVTASSTSASLPHEITGLLEDSGGRMWIDSSIGLYRLLDLQGSEIRLDAVSERLGLGGEPFGANLLEDARGRIWTHRRIYDPQTDRIQDLTLADGVGQGRFRSYAKSLRGELLFGDSEGLAVVNPRNFSTWQHQPPVVVTDLRIDGIERAYSHADGITLSAGERGFTVEFAALDYSAPQRLRYAFRLEGYEDAWRQTGAQQRIAAYANLWPGEYTLHVRGSNRNGVFSSHELRVPVRILPSWWQTPWFALLALLAVAALGWAAVRWRTLRLRARAAELGALVEARTAELRQSNVDLARSKREVETAHARLVNTQQQLVLQEKMAALGTLTAGVAHEINNPTNFADGAVQQLQLQHAQLHQFLRELAGADASPRVLEAIAARFGELAETTATAREGHQRIKRIVADLRQFTRLDEAEKKSVPVADPIQSTVNLVRTRFDRIRFELDLGFNPAIECQPAKLGQVFMNLVMNACEAIGECGDGRSGVVRIATCAIDDAVEIAIEDNGAGMDEDTRQHVFEPFFTTKDVGAGTGLGLAIVFGIVRDHGGSIDLVSSPGAGTRFTLRLPLSADRFA